MDILVTSEGEVAAVDPEQITIAIIGDGVTLSTGAVYPPGLTIVRNVTIPSGLLGKRLSYIDGVFAELPDHPKQVPVPQSVDPLPAIALLDRLGFGEAYKAYRDAPERTLLEQETLLRAKVWERSNPTLIAAATEIGLTSEQLDQLFIQIGY